jgi:integrase
MQGRIAGFPTSLLQRYAVLRRWWRRRRRRGLLIRTGVRLGELRRLALSCSNDEARTQAIDQANAVLAGLEAGGTVTRAERLELGRDWVKAFARDAVVDRFREHDALGVAQMTSFLKTG